MAGETEAGIDVAWAIDVVPAAALVHRRGVVVAANGPLAALVGRAPRPGSDLVDLVDDGDRGAAGALAVASTPTELTVRLRSGLVVDVRQHVLERGDDLLAIAVLADVTARASAEARYETMLANASDMVAVHVDGRFTYISPAVTRLLGWEPADCIGHHVSMMFHPDDRALLEERMRERQLGIPATNPGRYRLLCKHGGWRWVETVSSVHTGDGGFGGIVVNARDVTASVEAEDALRQSEARHRAMIEQLSDVVLVTDDAGTIRYVSPGVERMLGLRVELVTGLTIFTGMHRDDVERAHARLGDALAGGAGLYGPERFRYRHADGGWRHLETSCSNRLGDDAVGGLVFVIRDVSAQVEAEDRLRHLALHDSLTGLANRTLLTDRLVHALETGRRDRSSTALLVIDLDRFKTVNDERGHDAGDLALVTLAERMRSELRAPDTLGRLGGDEFAAVLPDIGDEHEAVRIANRLLAVLREPVRIGGADVVLGGSIGVALAPRDGDDPDRLLRGADLAMFRAKRRRLGVATCEPGVARPR